MIIFLLLWLIGCAVSAALVWAYTIGLGEEAHRGATPRAVVIVAVTGAAPEFDSFLRGLAAQDYPFFRVIFAVETADDRAAAAISRFHPDGHEVLLVTAGRAEDEGQKVTNLRAALRTLRPTDEIVVFADADIPPPRDWLTRLIAPLVDREGDITSGFAWTMAKDGTLAADVLASMSAILVTLPRLPLLDFARGGSTAMTRACCDALDLVESWRGALADDLQLTVLARQAGRRVVAPRELLQRVFIDMPDFAALIREVHLWLLLLRVHLPLTFALALAGLTFSALGWIAAVLGTLAGSRAALTVLVLAFALTALRAFGYAVIAKRLWGRAGLAESRRFCVMAPLVAPLASLFAAGCGWKAVFDRRTAWAGITYEIRGPRKLTILARRKA